MNNNPELTENGKIVKVRGKILNLSNLNISKISDFKDILNISSFVELYLNNNKIERIEGLDFLSSVELLNLGNNKIQDIKGLNSLHNLKVLYLNNNKIHKIEGLEELQNLKILDLSNNKIREIKGLNKLTNLETLFLSYNDIHKIKGLASLINLNRIYLNNNQIKIIKGLAYNRKLIFSTFEQNPLLPRIRREIDLFEKKYSDKEIINHLEYCIWKKINIIILQLYNDFRNKEIHRDYFLNQVFNLFEDTEYDSVRILCLDYLEKSNIIDEYIYKLLEYLLISDENIKIQCKAAKLIIKSYLEKGFKILKEFIDKKIEKKYLELIIFYLNSQNNKISEELLNWIKIMKLG